MIAPRTLLLATLALGCSRPPSPPSRPAPRVPSLVVTAPALDPPADVPTVAVADAPPGAPAARPLYYATPITPADLDGRTLRELSLLRNTIFARIGNVFRRRWLHDYFTAQPWYREQPRRSDGELTQLDRDNAAAVARYDTSLTREDLQRRRDALLERLRTSAATPEDAVERDLLSERLGATVAADNAPDAGGAPSPLEDPAMLDRQLTLAQLADLSRRDLRILRNMVYARRGRPFRSRMVREYFLATEWYRPDAAYTDARLTPLDERNVRVIRTLEDSLGGPLTDAAHGEDGFMAEA